MVLYKLYTFFRFYRIQFGKTQLTHQNDPALLSLNKLIWEISDLRINSVTRKFEFIQKHCQDTY